MHLGVRSRIWFCKEVKGLILEDIGTFLTWCSFRAGPFLGVHQTAGNCCLVGFPVRIHSPLSFSSIWVRLGTMEEPEMQLKVKKVTDKFTESMYVLANEPSVALYRLQEHVRRSLPELAQHKADMQSWEEQSQGAIYTVEYACSAIKNMKDSSVYFKSIESLLRHAIAVKDQLNSTRR